MIRDIQMLFAGAALGLVGMLSVYGWTPADAAKPSIIRDNCKGMSGGDGGLQCPSSDYLLVRNKDIWGNCGAWICCPPNGDGTYDCAHPVNPTRAAAGGVGTRRGVLDPGPKPPRSPAAPKPGSASPN